MQKIEFYNIDKIEQFDKAGLLDDTEVVDNDVWREYQRRKQEAKEKEIYIVLSFDNGVLTISGYSKDKNKAEKLCDKENDKMGAFNRFVVWKIKEI